MAIFTSRGAHVNCAIMAMLYTHSIGNPLLNTWVVFKPRDSVPSARYFPICNLLRQWKTSLIPIYRVYRLCDTICSSLTHSAIIESVDSISKDERGFPLTQYITNGRISRAG